MQVDIEHVAAFLLDVDVILQLWNQWKCVNAFMWQSSLTDTAGSLASSSPVLSDK
jgi:hypothetical protein